ncbi:S-Ena type endospore appendage [Bacillus cereus]|uniref:S-Ena type endospore appendage n=1 Tax=Bacillus cereus TaxID=1396 RepID=UPI000951F3FA|nr:S-Ena type endospore appendage [Bacillus cereus]OLR23845.1 hypothetical protein BLD50_20675 [Bacillus cereus]
MHKNSKFKKPLCLAFPIPEFPPQVPACHVICNQICGNIFLNNQVLEIWKKEIIVRATVTISVFNSILSVSSIKVTVIRNAGNPIELMVPPGNTLSTTVGDVQSVMVSQETIGIVEGKYCLEVCFAVSC